jgi:phosphatidylglycerol:prolipoprotein diacylglycerol transferase
MRQTLFHLPHALSGIPLFGWWSYASIALLLFVVVCVVIARGSEARRGVVESNWMVWLVAWGVLGFLIPSIETRIEGIPVGVPIRGYGVLLMLGVIAGSAVALRRAEARGISRDAFYSLATWTVVSGIIGARLFYVIQHWDTLEGESLLQKLGSVLKFTEGGLVVYGSVIAGLISIALWSVRFKYSLFKVADAVTPAFFLGLAFGRIGCLLNGCCYGGICDERLPSITFPSGSAVYDEQMETGKLLGITQVDHRIVAIAPDSWASRNGISVGQSWGGIQTRMVDGPKPENPLNPPRFEGLVLVSNRPVRFSAEDLPKRSIGVHPSQIYASIGGIVLFLWTMSLSYLVQRDGLIFASGLIAYGLVRTLEEYIRVDEAGQFGTELSIAQWISVVAVLIGVALWVRAWVTPTMTASSAVESKR